MKALYRTVAVVVATGTCAAAMAAGAHPAGKTRADVRSEVLTAMAQGELLRPGEATYQGPRQVTSERTRADVRQEVLQARAAGMRLPSGEAHPTQFAQIDSDRTRDEVRQELLSALHDGWHPPAGLS